MNSFFSNDRTFTRPMAKISLLVFWNKTILITVLFYTISSCTFSINIIEKVLKDSDPSIHAIMINAEAHEIQILLTDDFQLYNLNIDISQQNNLATSNPKKLNEMIKRYKYIIGIK